MVKRILVFILAAMLSLTTFVSCKKNGGGESQTNASAGQDYAKKLTIKWVGNTRMTIEADNPVEKMLEEKFNVDIQSIAASGDKLAAMIASNEIPDVMYMPEPSNWQPLADQGVIAEIPLDFIKQYAPNQYKVVEDTDKRIWGITKYKEKNWAIPKTVGAENNAVAVWRKDWLDKLGITKVPDTLAEYEDVFVKIRNNDPDGNGKKDTYGLTGLGGHAVRQFDEIFGAYGVMPGQWRVVNGKVVMSTIMPEAKEALTLLHKWYQMELIDPEMITETPQSSTQKFEAGRYGYLHTDLANYSSLMPAGKSTLELWKQRDPKASFTYGAIPSGPQGKRGDWLWGPRGNFVVFSAELEKDQEKMIRITKMMDAMISDEELALRVVWGEKGRTYDYNDPSKGAEGGLKYLPPYDTDQNKRAAEGIGQGGFYNLFQPVSGWALDSIVDKYSAKEYEEQTKKIAHWGQGQDDLIRPQLPSAALYQGNLDMIKSVAYTDFIIGKRSLDDFDKFAQEWLDKGGRKLTEEAQQFYEENIKSDQK